MGAAAGAAAAAAAAMANAISAAGAVVFVEAEEFQKILARAQEPLVVTAEAGFFKHKHQYLMSYKGLIFFASAEEAIPLPGDALIIKAEKIWVPNVV
jgi:ABC-type branched-subunit amino acid transport system substrate-binding protein